MIKKITAAICAVSLLAASLISCGGNDIEKFTANPWESAVGITEFKENGKICYNLEPEGDSVSYFKLLPGDRINFYTEEGEKYGMIFEYRFEGDNLYIGEAKYTRSSVAEYAEEKINGKSDTESAE